MVINTLAKSCMVSSVEYCSIVFQNSNVHIAQNECDAAKDQYHVI